MVLSVTEIGPRHFEQYAVWEYCDVPSAIEVMVRPVIAIPIDDPYGRVVAVRGEMVCGIFVWLAIAGLDVDPEVSKITQQTYVYNELGQKLKLTGGGISDTADIEVFLNRGLEDIFPIKYDLTNLIVGMNASGAVALNDVRAVVLNNVELAKVAASRVAIPKPSFRRK